MALIKIKDKNDLKLGDLKYLLQEEAKLNNDVLEGYSQAGKMFSRHFLEMNENDILALLLYQNLIAVQTLDNIAERLESIENKMETKNATKAPLKTPTNTVVPDKPKAPAKAPAKK